MLEMRAIVIEALGREAVVQPIGQTGCGHCSFQRGCGSGVLAGLFCNGQPRHFRVLNSVHARVGDEVQVSLPDGVLLRGAIRMYVIPLLLTLAGGLCGAAMATAMRDAWAAGGALSGLVSGFLWARFSSFQPGQPVVSAIINSRSTA